MPNKEMYAGFWLRAVALIIDGAILFLPTAFLESILRAQVIGAAPLDPQAMANPEVAQMAFFVSLFVQVSLGLIYFGILQGYLQATPGKMVLGLRIVTTDMKRVSLPRMLGRYFAQFLSAIVLCLGYIWVGFQKEKQSWHDKLAKTYVVKKKALSSSQQTVLRKAA